MWRRPCDKKEQSQERRHDGSYHISLAASMVGFPAEQQGEGQDPTLLSAQTSLSLGRPHCAGSSALHPLHLFTQLHLVWGQGHHSSPSPSSPAAQRTRQVRGTRLHRLPGQRRSLWPWACHSSAQSPGFLLLRGAGWRPVKGYMQERGTGRTCTNAGGSRGGSQCRRLGLTLLERWMCAEVSAGRRGPRRD